MKNFILLILFLLPVIAFSQTSDEIKREANPEYIQTTDNSDYAQVLHNMIAARKSGNQAEFNKYLNELNSKYSGKGNVKQTPQLPENRNVLIPTMKQPEEVGSLNYWANGENNIFVGAVGSSSAGNPRSFNRMIKIETDTVGTLFVAFLSANKDSLYFYKSTNQGVSWSKIQSIYSGSTARYYNFDFAVTDSLGGFKIGMVVSIAPTATPYEGTVYYGDMLTDGSGFSPNLVWTPTAGRGIVGVVICTDGYNWAPGSTFWYIAAQNLNSTTGVTSFVPVAYTPNWGSTWVEDTARNTYNDYELDIDYNFNSDSIYVLLTNNLTTTNENLRLRYIGLSGWGTNVSWKQFNPATTAASEYNACLATNKKNNDMAITYTIDNSSNLDIYYSYAVGGVGWVTGNPVASLPNNETRAYVHSALQQSGTFRLTYCSETVGFDSVFYMSTANIATGFLSKTAVSRVNYSTGVLAPCVSAFMNGSSPGGSVVYAGNGPNNIWYNSSNLITEINPVSGNLPESFKLSQNYPNPFNPTTKINFSIPKNNFVTLKVYDVSGKEIATLVNQNVTAGNYEIDFDGSKLSSGIYFYKIITGDFSEVKKMMLIK